MPTVLHISAAGPVWWKKTAKGWVTAEEPGKDLVKDPVWVMSDLPEETFIEINVPRVFGADRSNFVTRQLASRFPETVFRQALPPRRKGTLMERLAPPVQTLAAVEPGERIHTALKPLTPHNVPIAGVWSTSAILTRLVQRSIFPRDMFVVLRQSTNLRILFLKGRAPVLTRLVRAGETAADQATEIVRTLRHLENTHVIERNAQRFGVLLLGTVEDLSSILTRERLDIVPATPLQGRKFDGNWQPRLFDLLCQSPMGQLAPLSYRASYLTRIVEKTAYIATALILMTTLLMASVSIKDILQTRQEQLQTQTSLNQLTAETNELDLAIQAVGVAPDTVRNALTMDTEEIVSAPDIRTNLVHLSHAIGTIADARLKSLQWQFLEPGVAACAQNETLATTTTATTAAPEPGSTDIQPPERKVELQMTLQLPDGSGPRKTVQQASEMTRQLGQIHGAVILLDPAKTLLVGDIRTNTSPNPTENSRELTWCLTLPGRVPPNTPSNTQSPGSKP